MYLAQHGIDFAACTKPVHTRLPAWRAPAPLPRSWEKIQRSGELRRMHRTHVHFASEPKHLRGDEWASVLLQVPRQRCLTPSVLPWQCPRSFLCFAAWRGRNCDGRRAAVHGHGKAGGRIAPGRGRAPTLCSQPQASTFPPN